MTAAARPSLVAEPQPDGGAVASGDRSLGPAEEEAASATVRAYLAALAARDFAAACERLTEAVRQDLVAASAGGSSPAGDCAEALELALGHVDPEGLATRLTGVPLEPARLRRSAASAA